MCGGVIFPYSSQYREELEKYYSPEQVEEFQRTGQVRSLYWQKGEPVLPVVLADDTEGGPAQPRLMRWGNRDKSAPFPQTGWARVDSLSAGKWSHLRPKPALIPVTHGVEKGKWFDIDSGIEGVVVERGGEERVYMLTDDATPEFLEVTQHARMPVLVGQEGIHWLEREPVVSDR